MTTQKSNSGIVRTFSAITVDSVEQSPYEKGGKVVYQAQIRQTVTTTYPGARIGNSMTASIFDTDAFGFEGQTYTSQRVTWLTVPEGTTVEQVEAQLAKFPNARIWSKYSNKVEDVMTEEQHYAVKSGQQDLAFFMDKLVIRDRNGNDLPGSDEEGKTQYRSNGFALEAKEDEDLRTFKGNNANVEATVGQLATASVGGSDDQNALGA